MRRFQVVGFVSLVLGLLLLFYLRDPLYSLVVVLLNLIGIVIGIIMVIVGVALLLGGKAFGRRFTVSYTLCVAGKQWRMNK